MVRALKREFSGEYDLTVAYSAAEARFLLSGQRRFDVVVCDVTMPEMDGLTLIDSIAAEHPNTRFVVLTGNCDAETYERASELDSVSCMLSKPASREAILDAISDAAASIA